MKFETERIHFLGDVQSLPLPWARYERERDARVSSHARSLILRYIFLMGWPRALIRYFMTWVENK